MWDRGEPWERARGLQPEAKDYACKNLHIFKVQDYFFKLPEGVLFMVSASIALPKLMRKPVGILHNILRGSNPRLTIFFTRKSNKLVSLELSRMSCHWRVFLPLDLTIPLDKWLTLDKLKPNFDKSTSFFWQCTHYGCTSLQHEHQIMRCDWHVLHMLNSHLKSKR